jgi:uncharacterized membrane protein
VSLKTFPPPNNPALLQYRQERARAAENRLADSITRFAGSMRFVYIHVIWFAVWILLQVEHYPYGLLTMIVSLESIFLSTFLLISQNRADEKRQVLADEKWATVQAADEQNNEILRISKQILEVSMASGTNGTRVGTVSTREGAVS